MSNKKPAAPSGPSAAKVTNPLVPPDAPQSDHENTPSSTDGTRPRARIVEKKVKVRVHTPFRLTLDDGTVVPYAAGEQEVPASHADHFYAKHHIE